MVSIGGMQRRQEQQPVTEQCVTRARIYDDRHQFCCDVKRQKEHGWKLVEARWRQRPVQIDQIRASCPGTLMRFTTSEMVAFYTRCGSSHKRSLASIVPTRHA